MPEKKQARQFVQLYLDDLKDDQVSIAAKVATAYVRYRLYKRDGVELSVATIAEALGLGRRAAMTAVSQALEAGLITRSRSKRPGGAYVYRLPGEGSTAESQDVRIGTQPAWRNMVVTPEEHHEDDVRLVLVLSESRKEAIRAAAEVAGLSMTQLVLQILAHVGVFDDVA